MTPRDHDEEYNLLPEHVKAGIEEGLKQAENGQTISNEEFKKKYKRYFDNSSDQKLKL